MKTMNQLQALTVTMILGAALAGFGCSAAPGTTGTGTGNGSGSSGGGNAQGADGGLGGLFGQPPASPSTPQGTTATAKDFCTGLDTWLTKCGTTPAAGSEATCEQSYQKYTATQVSASEGCLTKVASCDSAALQQCLQQAVSGTATTPPGDAGAGPSACQACVDAQCATPVKGCEANAECVALYQCMQAAQTQADVQACEGQSPNGVTDLQALLQCVTGPCGAVCK
jgi:hypothetical protein